MMTRIVLVLLLWLSHAVCGISADARRGTVLDSLDAIIPQRHLYENDRRLAVERAREGYERATTPAERYDALRGLYESYRAYRVDSALIVAEWRLKIARELGVKSKIASATINLAEGYAKSGMAETAIAILDTLPETSLADYHHKYRNSVYRSAYAMKEAGAVLGSDRLAALERLRTYREEALRDAKKDSRSAYVLRAQKLVEAGMPREAISEIEKADRLFGFREDAAMQYAMAEIYLAAGDRDKAVECLARSALLDISSGTKEYMSLILLASLLFEDGDVERAFEYINCAFEDADFSKANLRAAEIMRSMPVIDKAFHDAQNAASERTRKLLILALCMGVLLLTAIVFLVYTLRQNRRMLRTIGEINGRLEERNEALVKSDSLKLTHINALMRANGGYIMRLKDFRKTIYRMLKTGQYDKAMDAVKSDKPEMRDVAEFHAMFDEAFLSMFPDFVDNVNALLREPVVLKNATTLTPELRVLALMRLGMRSAEEIAGMLHYSVQTVYNLRSSVRAMAAISRDEFEAAIPTL